MGKLINHFEYVGNILKLIIFCFCFGISGYYTIRFFLEYLQNPQSTSLTIDFIANQPFPAITICTGSDSYYPQSYNEDILLNCEIGQGYRKGSRAKSYRDGHWSSPKCPDPGSLFESLVAKPEELFDNITIGYYSQRTSEAGIIKPDLQSEALSHFDRQTYGRCYTVRPTPEMISNGIKFVKIYGLTKIAVYVHAPGLLETTRKTNKILVKTGEYKIYEVEHEIYQMLQYDGKPCDPALNFNKDTCEHLKMEKKLLESFGCTTPFGPNKESVCTDFENSTKAKDELWKTFSQAGGKYQCLYPCTLIHTRETFSRDYDAKKDQGLATISFHFQENIKVMKSSYLVSFYTLVSNIGGCIGIFLGWSILQLTDIIDSRFYKD